jgi:hypothetical protein
MMNGGIVKDPFLNVFIDPLRMALRGYLLRVKNARR